MVTVGTHRTDSLHKGAYNTEAEAQASTQACPGKIEHIHAQIQMAPIQRVWNWMDNRPGTEIPTTSKRWKVPT